MKSTYAFKGGNVPKNYSTVLKGPIPTMLRVVGFVESSSTTWILLQGWFIPEFKAVMDVQNFMDVAVNSSIIEGVIEGPFAWFSRGGYTSVRKLSRDELTE